MNILPGRFLKLLLIFACLDLITPKVNSQENFEIEEHAAWVRQIDFEQDETYSMANFEQGGLFLLINKQANVIKHEVYNQIVIEIVSESGIQSYADFWIEYDPAYQKLIFHKLCIHRNGTLIDKLDKDEFRIIQNESDLEAQIYNGSLSAGCYLKDLQVGDIIEYSYTIVGGNPVLNGNYFDSYLMEFDVSVKRVYYSVLAADDTPLHYKLIKTDMEPRREIQDGFYRLIWDIHMTKEILLNSEAPGWYITYPNVQFSGFNKWKELINWGAELYPDIPAVNRELDLQLERITRTCNSKKEEITKIIRFIQDEIRYVGIEADEHSYRPHQPWDVLENRFGDCKDKSYLLCTFLNNAGIEADVAYVNTYLKHNIAQFLPSPTIFNHAIVSFIYQGKRHFIDPTMTSQRGDFEENYSGDYRLAIVLDPTLDEPVKIPNNSPEKISIREVITVLDSAEPVRFQVETTYMGGEADRMRYSFLTSGRKDMENNFLNFYSYYYPEMYFIDELGYIDNGEENTFMVKEDYHIPSFWEYVDDPDIDDLVCYIAASNLYSYISAPKERNRKTPFGVFHPIQVDNEIIFRHSKEVSIEDEKGEIRNPAFLFTYDIEQVNNRTISFIFKYQSLKDHVPPSQLRQYLKDIEELQSMIQWEFMWGKDVNEEDGFNWLLLILSILFMLILSYFAVKLYKKDIHEEAPLGGGRQLGGWLIIPSIGLILTPPILIYNISTSGFFSSVAWDFISNPQSEAYSALWSVSFVVELLVNCLFLVYSVLLIFLLFKKRTTFPMHYVIFRISLFVFLLVDYVVINQLGSAFLVEEPNDAAEIVRSFLGVAIWVPYMLLSNRVEETFVRKYRSHELEKRTENKNGISFARSMDERLKDEEDKSG